MSGQRSLNCAGSRFKKPLDVGALAVYSGRMNKRLLLIPAIALLAACSGDEFYDAKPVVSPQDPRETEVPDVDDKDGREQQDCFMIRFTYDAGWDWKSEGEGIACMMPTSTTEVPK